MKHNTSKAEKPFGGEVQLHYKTIFEKSPDAILIMKAGAFIDCNNAAVKMYGLQVKGELIGKEPFDFSPQHQPDGQSSYIKGNRMIDIAYEKGSHLFEWVHMKNGEEFYTEVLLIALEEGTRDVMYVLIRDITEKKRTQQRSSERDNMYRSFFLNNNVAMILFDPVSQIIRDVNPAACNFYGYTRREMLALKMTDINILSPAEIAEEFQRAKNEGRRHLFFRHRLANGQICDVEAYRGYINVEGKDLCFSIIYDITLHKKYERELQYQKSLFVQLFENCPEAIVMLDNRDRIININNSFEEIFQYSLEEVRGKEVNQIIVPDILSEEASNWSEGILEGGFIKKETQRRRKDGTLIDVSILGYPIFNNDQQVGIFGIYTNISARKESEHKFNLFAKLLENNTEGVIITDVKGNIQWVNRAFTSITGYDYFEVINKNPRILKSHKQDKDFYQSMWESITHNSKWHGEVKNKRKSGEIYSQSLNIFAMYDGDIITHYGAILKDITELKEREEKIKYLAFRDSLTGLYNRAMFNERLLLEISKAKRKDLSLAILFMDMDGFKAINDTLGHGSGDKLLKQIADKLMLSTRESDTIARYGGDEFIILLPELIEGNQINKFADKIIQIFRNPWVVDDHIFYLTASIGVSIFPQDGTDADELIRKADAAMYIAKETGKNQYRMYSKDINTKTSSS